MSAILLKIHPDNPSPRQISRLVEILKKGGVIIYPTDTVYGLGCNIFSHRAVEKVAKIKGVRIDRANFSFIFYDLSQLSDYARHVSNSIFKLMKHYLPGPYTFIVEANNKVPKLFRGRKKIGIRIPDNNIVRAIVRELGNPLLTTSVHDDDKLLDYTTDPELIYEQYKKVVDAVVNGGYCNNEPSTVVDCTKEEPAIIRQGIGVFK
jgi:tRNA threonylcarbamoyl adenosine modification protein (Sua5/YciO/YrdC/YwlC family)